jgi:site-specific DNA recombinase
MTGKSLCVIYTRVSTDEQAREGYSLADQERRCRERIDNTTGWQYTRTYSDPGLSGAVRDRPGLGQLLADLDRIDVVVIAALDRLGRDVGYLTELFETFDRASVHLDSLGQQLGDNSASGFLSRGVLGLLSHYERLLIGERVQHNALERAKQGKSNGGGRTYGYRSVKGVLQIVLKEKIIVIRIYDRFLAGVSQSQIARDLSDDGVPTLKGRWNQATVSAILRNPVYRGLVRFKGELYPGKHEAIIDEDTWNAVATVRASRNAPGRGKGRPSERFLLTKGMLKCRCGATMIVRPSRDYYECSGRKADLRTCDQKPVNRELVDGSLTAYFEREGYDANAVHRELVRAAQGRLEEARQLREQAEREVTKSVERLGRVKRDYQDGRLDADDWNEQREQLIAEREAAEAQAGRLRRREMTAVPPADEQLAEIRSKLGSDDTAAIRVALQRLFVGFHLGLSGAETPELAEADCEPAPETDNLLDPVEVGGALKVWAELNPAAVLGIDDDQAPVLDRQPIHMDRITLATTRVSTPEGCIAGLTSPRPRRRA